MNLMLMQSLAPAGISLANEHLAAAWQTAQNRYFAPLLGQTNLENLLADAATTSPTAATLAIMPLLEQAIATAALRLVLGQHPAASTSLRIDMGSEAFTASVNLVAHLNQNRNQYVFWQPLTDFAPLPGANPCFQ